MADDAKTLARLKDLATFRFTLGDDGVAVANDAADLIERLTADLETCKAICQERGQNLSNSSDAIREQAVHLEACRNSQRGLMRRVGELTAANARLTAEVERLRPKPMTLERAVEVFNRRAHRCHGRRRITMGNGDFDAVCDSGQNVYYPGWEAKAIAEKYVGPIAGPLEQEVGG